MRGISAYKKQTVRTSSNEELVLRLYERAIVCLWEGHTALEENNKISAIIPLQHVRAIISELMSALDHSSGQELTANLHQLYLWLLKEISRAGFEGDVERLQNAIIVVENLYEGFREAFLPGEG
jgi:flagellar protein FliS